MLSFSDVLGNSYLSCFFLAGQSPNDLKQSMVAYSRAVSLFSQSFVCCIE